MLFFCGAIMAGDGTFMTNVGIESEHRDTRMHKKAYEVGVCDL